MQSALDHCIPPPPGGRVDTQNKMDKLEQTLHDLCIQYRRLGPQASIEALAVGEAVSKIILARSQPAPPEPPPVEKA